MNFLYITIFGSGFFLIGGRWVMLLKCLYDTSGFLKQVVQVQTQFIRNSLPGYPRVLQMPL